jgi:putative membrane protein
MMNGWDYNNMGGGAWALMILLMIIFWVVVVTGIVAFIRRSNPTTSSTGPTAETPEQVLRARFARGEIDEAEFRVRMAALKEFA